jgi:hypothetical protein
MVSGKCLDFRLATINSWDGPKINENYKNNLPKPMFINEDGVSPKWKWMILGLRHKRDFIHVELVF